MNAAVLRIALPSIVSNITVPLLGLIDIAITGHLGSASYIGAVAVGGTFFNIVYWLFGFLRMGTGGLTAQAFGAKDSEESSLILSRSLILAMAVAFLLILLQSPIFSIAFHWLNVPADVQPHAYIYCSILIWGAPAVLAMYSFTGWFLGMQNAHFPMWIAIIQNLVNITASIGFVYGVGMKVDGIAYGTLIAQYTGLLLAIILWKRKYARATNLPEWKSIFNLEALRHFFRVNRAIFLRTLCLIIVSTYFTSFGASGGSTLLAANTLLMQFFLFFSYVMDGFAYAGEALGGKFYGARNRGQFSRLVRNLFKWGSILSLLFTIVYALGGDFIISLLTDETNVRTVASNYLPYAIGIPIVSFSAFLFDGIFIGTTDTRAMLLSMLCATATFFLVFRYSSAPHNHALWLAFLSYLLTRSIVSLVFYKLNRTFVKQ